MGISATWLERFLVGGLRDGNTAISLNDQRWFSVNLSPNAYETRCRREPVTY
jgi:hypothetical protein